LEAPQLPRSLDDQKVSIAIINNTFAGPAGLVAKRDGLFVEDEHSPYVNIIVSREENKTQPGILTFVKSYQSPEVAAAAEVAFKGGAVKGCKPSVPQPMSSAWDINQNLGLPRPTSACCHSADTAR